MYRVPHLGVAEFVADLEANGEQLVSHSSDDGGLYIGTIRKPKIGRPAKADTVETRG
jgi:hypothetical protein